MAGCARDGVLLNPDFSVDSDADRLSDADEIRHLTDAAMHDASSWTTSRAEGPSLDSPCSGVQDAAADRWDEPIRDQIVHGERIAGANPTRPSPKSSASLRDPSCTRETFPKGVYAILF